MEIKWVQINSKSYLKFTFNEYLEEKEALEGIDTWVQEFSSKPNARIPLIWDCTVMKGYDRQSRIHWQKKTKELKDQIDIIWLISNS